MKWVVLLLLAGCATTPVVNTSPYARCAASCPDGQAMSWENSTDTACFCRRPPVGSWMPAPRKRETERCEHAVCEPRLVTTVKQGAIEYHDGPQPTWRWACQCGWADSLIAKETPPC